MSNVKMVRLIADVPFNYLNWQPEGGLPEAEIACLASVLLTPSIGLAFSYQFTGYEPNDHGGQTTMYRLTIEGQEALPWPLMKRMAMAIKRSSPLAKLHIAEAMDIEDGARKWEHIVDKAELSGEAL